MVNTIQRSLRATQLVLATAGVAIAKQITWIERCLDIQRIMITKDVRETAEALWTGGCLLSRRDAHIPGRIDMQGSHFSDTMGMGMPILPVGWAPGMPTEGDVKRTCLIRTHLLLSAYRAKGFSHCLLSA